jgi:hypothetical protein
MIVTRNQRDEREREAEKNCRVVWEGVDDLERETFLQSLSVLLGKGLKRVAC